MHRLSVLSSHVTSSAAANGVDGEAGSASEYVADKLVSQGSFPNTGRYHRLPRKLSDDYQLSETVLGSGLSGDVRMALQIRGTAGRRVAVKTLNFQSLQRHQMNQLQAEVEIFLICDHPHITRLYDVYEMGSNLHLVMECMSGGELFDRLVQAKRFPEEDAADVMWQVLLAANHLHSRAIVHRDLKLENFLFAEQGCRHLKLIDFGFSKFWDNSKGKMQASLGSMPYIAPEVIGRRYSSQCDLWSAGVMAFVLLRGFMPFSSSDILAGFHSLKPQRWGTISRSAAHFTESLLAYDPCERMTAAEGLWHPWLAQRRQQQRELCVGIVDALRGLSRASRFRRACLQLVAWSLSREECRNMREVFLAMDTDFRGAIKRKQFKEALCPLGASCDEIERAFRALDFDCDEEIQYSDILAAMISTNVDLREELVCSAFRRFDRESTGYITADDLRDVLGDTFRGQCVESLLREVGGLPSEGISYEDFLCFLGTVARCNRHDAEHEELRTRVDSS